MSSNHQTHHPSSNPSGGRYKPGNQYLHQIFIKLVHYSHKTSKVGIAELRYESKFIGNRE
ncbi:MAG: hypothetical protein F6K18_02540 [Okeania sp. SIO2C2]|uniref:hypothetical protein n=1 Tax=Okeania sp. SIO2C2 TaxID=2607787 RepID=UPI0013BB62F3|nr:hypothetical protein [Okeania sp. SIO2C2]NEP85788.1 hypothetical protein [Okeania sp. SIO2C2]